MSSSSATYKPMIKKIISDLDILGVDRDQTWPFYVNRASSLLEAARLVDKDERKSQLGLRRGLDANVR